MILPSQTVDALNKVKTTNNLQLEIYSRDADAGIRISDNDSIHKIYLESKSILETLGVI